SGGFARGIAVSRRAVRRRATVGVFVMATTLAAVIGGTSSVTRAAVSARPASTVQPRDAVTPIRHVVVIFQENHSFDNVLGGLCVIDARCDGVTSGKLDDGTTIPLPPADNHVPNAAHSFNSQQTAINGGAMNGFSVLRYCTAD